MVKISKNCPKYVSHGPLLHLDALNLIFLLNNDYQGEIPSAIYWEHNQREEGTAPPPPSPHPFEIKI